MSDLIHLNGGTRSALSRGKDFITTEKVQAAVDILIANDTNLSENQSRLLTALNDAVARIVALETERDAPKPLRWYERAWARVRGLR